MKKKTVALLLAAAMTLTACTNSSSSENTAPENTNEENTSEENTGDGQAEVSLKAIDKSTQPRIIITTDLEVDDMNGVLLALMFSSDFDLAGLVWTAGQFHFNGDGVHTLAEITPNYACTVGTNGGEVKNAGELKSLRPVEPTFLNRIIDVSYRADYEYLSKNNPNYPTPEYLLSIAKEGNVEFEGDYREETEGSKLIYECILDDDPRPLHIHHWGGVNTTVRALLSIYEDYQDTSEWKSIQKKVADKVVFYKGGEDNCREDSKIDEMFPGLKTIDRIAFEFQDYFGATKPGEGPIDFIGTTELVNPYYQAEWLSDAFKFHHGRLLGEFHLMNDGQIIYGDPLIMQYGLMTYIDWDEQLKAGYGEGDSSFPRFDYETLDWMCAQCPIGPYLDFGLRWDYSYLSEDDRYEVAMFEDLAARADWAFMEPSECNHAPIVEADTLDHTAKAGDTVELAGSASDPDGDKLDITWWVPAESCVYSGKDELSVSGDDKTAKFTVPEDAVADDIFVVNMEVKDTGAERPMTRYAQFAITVE